MTRRKNVSKVTLQDYKARKRSCFISHYILDKQFFIDVFEHQIMTTKVGGKTAGWVSIYKFKDKYIVFITI